MYKIGAFLACLVIIASDSAAQAAHGSFGGMPGSTTRQMVARVSDKDLELWDRATKCVPETRVRKETFQVGDKTEEREIVYTVVRQVHEIFMRHVELEQVKAFGADRKPIKRRQLAERLAEAKPVLVVEHDAKIDPRYLKLVRDDTIFIVLAPPKPAIPQPVAAEAAVPQQPSEPPVFPVGEQPTVALATYLESGGLQVRHVSTITSETTGYRLEGEAGAEQQVPVSIKQTRRNEVSQEFKVQGVKAFTVAGDEVPAEELQERLAKETPVLVSADARPVDPGYLQIIREDALILVVPVAQPFGNAGAVAPQVAPPIAPPVPVAEPVDNVSEEATPRN